MSSESCPRSISALNAAVTPLRKGERCPSDSRAAVCSAGNAGPASRTSSHCRTATSRRSESWPVPAAPRASSAFARDTSSPRETPSARSSATLGAVVPTFGPCSEFDLMLRGARDLQNTPAQSAPRSTIAPAHPPALPECPASARSPARVSSPWPSLASAHLHRLPELRQPSRNPPSGLRRRPRPRTDQGGNVQLQFVVEHR